MKGTTHVLAIIDMSGSMGPLARDVREGFNEFLNELRASDSIYRVTAVLFDDRYQSLCIAAPLNEVPRLHYGNYVPRGWTALYDAVGRTIDDFEDTTSVGPNDRVLLFVQTDGYENMSKFYGAETVANMIRQRTETGRWDFKYIGSHPDAWAQAGKLGFQHANTVTTSHSSGALRGVYRGMASGTIAYAAGASGQSVTQILNTAISEGDQDEKRTP